jgi:hypothetical protein
VQTFLECLEKNSRFLQTLLASWVATFFLFRAAAARNRKTYWIGCCQISRRPRAKALSLPVLPGGSLIAKTVKTAAPEQGDSRRTTVRSFLLLITNADKNSPQTQGG